MINYRSDADLVCAHLPEPLEPAPSVNCPLADLPARQVVSGLHMVTDMTLPYGRVIHDYLAK